MITPTISCRDINMAMTTLSKHIDTVSVLYDVLLTKPIYLMHVDLFSQTQRMC